MKPLDLLDTITFMRHFPKWLNRNPKEKKKEKMIGIVYKKTKESWAGNDCTVLHVLAIRFDLFNEKIHSHYYSSIIFVQNRNGRVSLASRGNFGDDISDIAWCGLSPNLDELLTCSKDPLREAAKEKIRCSTKSS